MRATLRMPIDTLFGNRLEIEVNAELINTHDPTSGTEETNRLLLEDMTRVLTYAIEAIKAEDERHRIALLETTDTASEPPPER